MDENLQKLETELKKRSIYELRQIGRAVGVKRPADMNKQPLVDAIMAIASGESDPVPRAVRGAPPKSEVYDKNIVTLVEYCRDQAKSIAERQNADVSSDGKTEDGLKVEEGLAEEQPAEYPCEGEERVYSGVLEFTEKFWFVRTNNFEVTSNGDVFMHSTFVNRFRLREGDFIVCRARRRRENECPGATYIVSVNGVRPDVLNPRPVFERLTPCYPDTRYTLEREDGTLSGRIIDLFSPIGKGQRALIVSPPKAGKTTMLKDIACSITANYPEVKVIVLLINERPEEVTDIKRSVDGAEVIYSTFDRGEYHHIHTAMLALEHAKRLVEAGGDVVLLLDSITRLTRAYNSVTNSGRILSGGLDPQALIEPRKFFGSARNIENGGSLTIIATALVDTGSRLDDVIYEEFKSAGNMEIVLSRDMAESRVFPAIDVKASGARKEDLLLSKEELSASYKFRQMLGKRVTPENLFSMIAKTKNNKELCQRADEWLKIYYSNDR
ncbi:MAG: transcription termination factor Rho [Clostridia bacterium]|nr:transcription termination factor Rho [Clostridia bacterium]